MILHDFIKAKADESLGDRPLRVAMGGNQIPALLRIVIICEIIIVSSGWEVSKWSIES